MYTFEKMVVGGISAERMSTMMENGTYCAVLKPDDWNGVLLLDLDGGAACHIDAPMEQRRIPRTAGLLSQGYAIGGTTREPVGYRFPVIIDMLVSIREAFIEKYGKPEHTLATGISRGGFVGRLCMEMHPEIFEGAMVCAGGGGGEVSGLNSKLDGKWTMNTLLEPAEPLELVNVKDMPEETRRMEALIALADSTPLGRARMALAAAFEQFPLWSSYFDPEPAPGDWDECYRQMRQNFAMGQFIFGAVAIERVAGGAMSWNHDVDYAELLEKSGTKPFVEAMYEKAGVGAAGLQADLDKLAAAPRIHADPEAVARIEKTLTYTGKLQGPIMNMDNVSDQADPAPCKYEYLEMLKTTGCEDLARVAWVKSAGHGNFADFEYIASVDVLLERVKSGVWPDVSPAAMNERANALIDKLPQVEVKLPANAPKRPDAPAQARFTTFTPVRPLHTWDYRNWDSYKG